MWFVGLGLVVVLLHFAGIGPPGRWNFEVFGDLWKFLLPFGLALAWWAFADAIGLTQKRAMQKMEDRKTERRERAMEALGMDAKRHRHVSRARNDARRAAADNPPPPPPPPVKLTPDLKPGEAEPRREPRM